MKSGPVGADRFHHVLRLLLGAQEVAGRVPLVLRLDDDAHPGAVRALGGPGDVRDVRGEGPLGAYVRGRDPGEDVQEPGAKLGGVLKAALDPGVEVGGAARVAGETSPLRRTRRTGGRGAPSCPSPLRRAAIYTTQSEK